MKVENIKKYFGFIAVGLPAFVLAVPLNYFLVDFCLFSTQVAYALVLVFQVTLNFFMCRWLVFEKKAESNLWMQFLQFMTAILAVRVLDWGLYVILVKYAGVYYLVAQIGNVFLFSVMKFLFAKKLFEGSKKIAS